MVRRVLVSRTKLVSYIHVFFVNINIFLLNVISCFNTSQELNNLFIIIFLLFILIFDNYFYLLSLFTLNFITSLSYSDALYLTFNINYLAREPKISNRFSVMTLVIFLIQIFGFARRILQELEPTALATQATTVSITILLLAQVPFLFGTFLRS